MVQEQFSLSWDAYQKNICHGLSSLQQRGEFVDMTLAADGHHVKVHQLVLSLVSPYIKELIASAQCPHPVIFLNNISYPTLCAILEYIYTGEVHVAKDKLTDLIIAGRALHIKGLQDIEVDEQTILNPKDTKSFPTKRPPNTSIAERLREQNVKKKKLESTPNKKKVLPMCEIFVDNVEATNMAEESVDMDNSNLDTSESYLETSEVAENVDISDSNIEIVKSETLADPRKAIMNPKMQFSLSIQGGLQIIYNRYIYHLRYYSSKTKSRLWRCIDYSLSTKCPANICTNENNEVTSRSFTHNHPFHDKKILKKHSMGLIFAGFQEANNLATNKKNERKVVKCPPVDDANLTVIDE